MRDRILRHERKAHACHHHPLDPVFPLAAERGVKLDLSLAAHRHHFLSHLAGETIDIGIGRNIGQPYCVLALQRMARRYDHNVSLAIQRLRTKTWRVSVRCVQNPEIEVTSFQSAAKIGQIALMHAELDSWMVGLESREEGGEADRPDRRHDTKLKRRLMQQTKLIRHLSRSIRLTEHLFDMRPDAVTEIGQKHSPPFTMEERSSEFVLEFLDGERECGL